MGNLQLPIGVENYKVACSCYYVDKTAFLEKLIDLPETSALLISRPRRFGKSLALSMVDYFFSPAKADKTLFEDKTIWNRGAKYQAELGSSPVIRISMKDVIATSFDEILDLLAADIASLYLEMPCILEKAQPEEKEDIAALREKRASSVLLSRSLRLLLKLSCGDKKPILLIDEYDAPLIQANQSGFYEEAKTFFKSFYGSALKGNDDLRFAIITGTSEISKDSLFSGVNNLRVYTPFDAGFDEDFGFTQPEVEHLLAYYGIASPIERVSDYYGGYHFGRSVIFNPWSILKFVESGGSFKTYWNNAGSNFLIGDIVEFVDEGAIEIISRVLSGEKAYVELEPAASFADIQSRQSVLYSLLVQSGYFTYEEGEELNEYSIFLPNLESKSVFRTEIKERYGKVVSDSFVPSLKRAFLEGDSDRIGDYFGRYILSCFSYFDFPDYRNYQALVLGAAAVLFDYATVRSEVNAGLGRCDILVSPRDKSLPAFVIEVKHHEMNYSSSRLKASAESAIKQIRRKGYAEELVRNGYSDIRCCGFAFKQTLVQVAIEKL